MGYGDEIMGSGLAKGAAARGKRIAFGDKQKIYWSPFATEIFRGNPNVAPPGSEKAEDIEWIVYYQKWRMYIDHRRSVDSGHWVFNYDFRAIPGEVYGLSHVKQRPDNLVIIEPNVPNYKSAKVYQGNKQWPVDRYQLVANELKERGFVVAQFWHGRSEIKLDNVHRIKTPTFRDALANIKTARLYIGPEGGLHHGAAAVGTRAVVMFGGFIPPQVTGYDAHINLTGGAEACGSFARCQHCAEAMNNISVADVLDACEEVLCR